MAIRTEVLGADYVGRARESAARGVTAPLQELLAEYGWGTVWARDVLSRRERSLLTVALLCALNRPNELALHLGGALRNGASVADLQETLLQVAVYVGIPASLEGFHALEAVVAQQEPKET
jgi:4-carboxymuconolactone decarboxylase